MSERKKEMKNKIDAMHFTLVLGVLWSTLSFTMLNLINKCAFNWWLIVDSWYIRWQHWHYIINWMWQWFFFFSFILVSFGDISTFSHSFLISDISFCKQNPFLGFTQNIVLKWICLYYHLLSINCIIFQISQ